MIDKRRSQRDQHLVIIRILLYQPFQKWKSFQAFALAKERRSLLSVGGIRSIRIRLGDNPRHRYTQIQEQYKKKAFREMTLTSYLLSTTGRLFKGCSGLAVL